MLKFTEEKIFTLAQIHYVLIHPDYQGQGIAGKMLEYIKKK